MKIAIILLLAAVAIGPLLFPLAYAAGTTDADPEERRGAMLGTFLLLSTLLGGLCIIFVHMTKKASIELEMESSSVFVPPIKQESNIVQGIINS